MRGINEKGKEGEEDESRGGGGIEKSLMKFCEAGIRAEGRLMRGEGAGKGHSGSTGLRADVPSLQTYDQLRGKQVAKYDGPRLVRTGRKIAGWMCVWGGVG